MTATAMMAAIGDVNRSRPPSIWSGISISVRECGSPAASQPSRGGSASKDPGPVRGLLVEAAWHAARATGPLRAFHQRVPTGAARTSPLWCRTKLVVIAVNQLRPARTVVHAPVASAREAAAGQVEHYVSSLGGKSKR